MTQQEATSLDQLIQDLRAMRDEVRVKAHLAGKDLQDVIDANEKKLEELQRRVDAARKEAEARAPEIRRRFEGLVDEIREGYERVRAKMGSGPMERHRVRPEPSRARRTEAGP
jgi:hypothetical protein